MSDDTGLDSTMLSRTSGASSTCTPADSSMASSCSRTTCHGRAISGASLIVRLEQSLRLGRFPTAATQRATSQRGCDPSSASASIGSTGCRQHERVALAVEPAQHRVRELARADAVPALCQLHGLRDRRVRRHALHVQQLRGAKSQQVVQVGVEAVRRRRSRARRETRRSATGGEACRTTSSRSPAAIARVEPRGPAVERRIEQARRRGDRRRSRPRRRARRSRPPIRCTATPPLPPGRTMVLICAWHTC